MLSVSMSLTNIEIKGYLLLDSIHQSRQLKSITQELQRILNK